MRREAGGWQEKQVSNWENSRVDLDKSGALYLPINTSEPAFLNSENQIVVPASWHGKRWEWILDPSNLSVLSGGQTDRPLPEQVMQYANDNGIPFRVLPLDAEQEKPSDEYFLSWEAMPPNRDQAREHIPAPSTLRVHYVKRNGLAEKEG